MSRSVLRALEGCRVSLALADGRRIDKCQLVSAGRGRLGRAWIFADGADAFVSLAEILDVWEEPLA